MLELTGLIAGQEVAIFDAAGRAVAKAISASETLLIDCRGLVAGVYYVKILNNLAQKDLRLYVR
jgi:hypothetical protein